MPYAIARSPSRPQGGHIHGTNDEWSQQALEGGYGALYSGYFKGDPGDPIDPAKAPQYVIVSKPRPQLPDMFWSSCSVLIVSSAYHDIIESFDPGLHQFWPMEIRRKRKGPYPGQWYGLNIRPRAAAIQEEGSDTRRSRGSESLGIAPKTSINISFKTSVWKDALPDYHLWWDDGIDDPIILCSDALRDAVLAAGLKSIPFVKATVV